MKYRLMIIAGLLGSLFSCEKEMSPGQAEKFIKYYGSLYMDQASDLEALTDGGYAICGTDSSFLQGKRMVLVLTDEYGNLRSGFPKYYTAPGMETGANSLVAIRGGQGGFLLGGYIEKPVSGSTDVQKDMLMVKTNSTGQEIWQRSYGSSENESILDAVESISSGYILAGYQIKDGRSDILIMGIEEEGDSIPLSLNYNNPYAKNAAASYLLNAGDKYLCVCTYDKINNPDTTKAGTDILILSFDDELSPLDENLTGDADEYGMCIVEDDTDKYLVLGNRINVTGKSEMVLHLIETDGMLIRKSVLISTIAESNTDLTGRRLVRTSDGKYAIVGTREMKGEKEMFLQFLTSDYAASTQLTFGASGAQTGADIELSNDGGILLLGTNSYGGNGMITLIKTGDSGDL